MKKGKKVIALVEGIEILPDRVREIVELGYERVEDPETLSDYFGNEEEAHYFMCGEEEVARDWAKSFERRAKTFKFAIIRIERDGRKSLHARAFDEHAAFKMLVSYAVEDVDEVDDMEIARTLAYEHDGVVWRALPFEFQFNFNIEKENE